jgi:flagellar biosynthesis protein FlhB
LATGMTVLSVLPPAKGVGMAGKTAVKGINAATKSTKFSFSMLAKTPDVLKSIRNVLSTQKVLEVFKGIYKEVILGSLADTKLLID